MTIDVEILKAIRNQVINNKLSGVRSYLCNISNDILIKRDRIIFKEYLSINIPTNKNHLYRRDITTELFLEEENNYTVIFDSDDIRLLWLDKHIKLNTNNQTP